MATSKQLRLSFPSNTERQPEVLQLLTPDDIYAEPERLVMQIKEGRQIERKGSQFQAHALGEYLSMWANTAPIGGLIAFGINKDGTIDGCEHLGQKTLNRIEQTGQIYCPLAQYETKPVPVINKNGERDFILLFRVLYHPTRVVATSDGHVFIRRGDSKIELKTDEEKRQLRIDKGEIQYEQEPSGLKFPDDFDMPLVRQFCGNVRKLRQIDQAIDDVKIMTALRMGKLTKGEFVPNLACAIVFALDPVQIIPGCKIHFLRFEGIDARGGTKFNETADIPPLEGPLPRQIDQINVILRAKIRKFSGFTSAGKFQTTPEYPEEAWAEAVVNACVHRSYVLKNMKIFVRMFDDRLEIESPGPFPPGVTPESIYHVQHSRNPYLMEVMRYLGYSKEIGEGVPRIRDSMLSLGLPAPEFKQVEVDSAKVVVTLKNSISLRKTWVDSDVAEIIGAAITKSLTEEEKILLNFVVVHGGISVSDAARLTGHNWHTSRKGLRKLEDKGILKYIKRPGLVVDRQARFALNTELFPDRAETAGNS